MKYLLLMALCLALFTSCHVNRSTIQMTQHERVKYKLQPVPDTEEPDYFTYTAMGFNKASGEKYNELLAQLNKFDDEAVRAKSQEDKEFYSNSRLLILSQMNELPKDSTINYIVSFQDYIPGINYTIVRTYWWDYSNIRFLVPFLDLFDRWHNYNQCVNRAVEKCMKYNCDGVIIAGDYSTFKLFRVKQGSVKNLIP